MPITPPRNADVTDESLLWQRFQTGDVLAFERLYRHFQPVLLRYGRVFACDRTTLEDAIQDVFAGLWHRRAHLAPTDSARYYLLACLRHRLQKEIAKQPSPSVYTEGLGWEPTVPSIEHEWLENEAAQERERILETAFSRLSKRQREVMRLKYLHEWETAQICAHLRLGQQSVYNVIHRSLRRLRKRV